MTAFSLVDLSETLTAIYEDYEHTVSHFDFESIAAELEELAEEEHGALRTRLHGLGTTLRELGLDLWDLEPRLHNYRLAVRGIERRLKDSLDEVYTVLE